MHINWGLLFKFSQRLQIFYDSNASWSIPLETVCRNSVKIWIFDETECFCTLWNHSKAFMNDACFCRSWTNIHAILEKILMRKKSCTKYTLEKEIFMYRQKKKSGRVFVIIHYSLQISMRYFIVSLEHFTKFTLVYLYMHVTK